MQHGFGRLILHALPRAPPGITLDAVYSQLESPGRHPSRTTIRKHLATLLAMNVVQRQAGSRGKHAYWRATDSVLDVTPPEVVHA